LITQRHRGSSVRESHQSRARGGIPSLGVDRPKRGSPALDTRTVPLPFGEIRTGTPIPSATDSARRVAAVSGWRVSLQQNGSLMGNLTDVADGRWREVLSPPSDSDRTGTDVLDGDPSNVSMWIGFSQ